MVVTGKELIPSKGPLLIAVNHPNTFMDPLIIATITRQRVGFIGNAGIFGNKLFDSILRYFHVIPIYRKKDISPDEKPDNAASFAACHRYFDTSGTLLIFPEGTSHYELKLRPIKTGTARIALSYEKLKDYQGNLKITPISLDYSDSLQFRSMLSVNVGQPIFISQYKSACEEDEIECVKALTEEIRKSLAARIPQTIDKDQETFLINVHRFYTTFCETEANLYINPRKSLTLRTTLAKLLQDLKFRNEELYCSLQSRLERFYDALESQAVTSGFYTDAFRTKRLPWVYMGYCIIFITLLPFYALGVAANLLPYLLPSKLFELLKIDIEYKTSVALVAGLVLFPLFYGLELMLFRYFIGAGTVTSLAFLILLPISGYVAMYYWTNLKRFLRLFRFNFSIRKEEKNAQIQLRNEILIDIKEAKEWLD